MGTNIDKCCRVCLEARVLNMKTLEEVWDDGLTFLHLFEFLLGSELTENFSNYLCDLCEKRLIDAYLFKVQCLRSIKIALEREIKVSDGEEVTVEEDPHFEVLDNLEENTSVDLAKVGLPDDGNAIILNEDERLPEVTEQSAGAPTLRYGCSKCGVKFESYLGYQRHYRQNHRQKHVCAECGKLVTRQNLEKHRLSHSRPQHVCEACGRAFALKENLKKHIRIHEQDHQYKCEYCGKAFIHYNSKRCHVISQHTKEMKYECSLCGKKFASSSNMLRHVRYHTGEMSHSCSFCSKRFNTTSELKNHIATHTKEKNEICEICTKAFGTRRNLRNHLRTHAGLRDYVCPVCSRAFTQAHVLRTHLQKSHPDYPTPPPRTILSKKRLERMTE